MQMVRVRQAGLVFTTHVARKAAKFGKVGAVVRDGSIHVFPRIQMAMTAHEQH
jgi:hypothetical protein